MESVEFEGEFANCNDSSRNPRKKIVIVMGASGCGKSRLAIDLASHFPIEIINADSMQVYKGLDVLTNKVSLHEQKGVQHHLLGTINPNVEFTSKDFRDSAIPIIDEIISRNHLPVIVGGTNYYIQALVSPFLLDDTMEDMDESCVDSSLDEKRPDVQYEIGSDGSRTSYNRLKEIDPDAANRIHPNDYRKANQYLSLYERSGVLPSKIFKGQAFEKWGRVDSSRYDCCFLCVDASLPELDRYVEQRVDSMIEAGLLTEVYDVYNVNADYTRGLRQAIGVREFEDFLKSYLSNRETKFDLIEDKDNEPKSGDNTEVPLNMDNEMLKNNMRAILDSDNSQLKVLLEEAVDKLKANTRRLVRRQKRRLNRLQTLFGWNLHYVDATEALLGDFDYYWPRKVVEPSVEVIKSFLLEKASSFMPDSDLLNGMQIQRVDDRDLWTQYICEACGNRLLRGAHEWEQHKIGRGHRKRVLSLKKASQRLFLVQQEQQQAN